MPEHTNNEPSKITNSLPDHIQTSNPWISRFFPSQLLNQSSGPAGSESITTKPHEIYGQPNHPIHFHIGNGGAGFTGILRQLAETYIAQHGADFRIGWVPNHSRHSQIALLADVVHVALTYEPENEDVAVREGWTRRVGRVFNDHFVLVGPADAGAAMRFGGRGVVGVLSEIARANGFEGEGNGKSIVFHTRGDGSATFARERELWKAAGVDPEGGEWIKTFPLTPYDALVKAESDGAFLLSDRSTFLTAKRDGVIPLLRVHVEGGRELLNPCSALVKSEAFVERMKSEESGIMGAGADDAAARFAMWLTSREAQEVIGNYGRDWGFCKPLFTVADQDEFCSEDLLADT